MGAIVELNVVLTVVVIWFGLFLIRSSCDIPCWSAPSIFVISVAVYALLMPSPDFFVFVGPLACAPLVSSKWVLVVGVGRSVLDLLWVESVLASVLSECSILSSVFFCAVSLLKSFGVWVCVSDCTLGWGRRGGGWGGCHFWNKWHCCLFWVWRPFLLLFTVFKSGDIDLSVFS